VTVQLEFVKGELSYVFLVHICTGRLNISFGVSGIAEVCVRLRRRCRRREERQGLIIWLCARRACPRAP
jgi:hypothetical protein